MLGILVILDGVGHRLESEGNAVQAAHMEFFEGMKERLPFTTLRACGPSVGLVEGAVGNSEAGHLHIGAGRVVWQPLAGIDEWIKDGSFFENEAMCAAVATAKETGRPFHVMGLLSDGGVHAHVKHLDAVAALCRQKGVDDICVHAFGDGRDVDVKSLDRYALQVQEMAEKHGVNMRIVDIVGRYFAMDRDTNADRTQVAFDMLRRTGDAPVFDSVSAALEFGYETAESDYYLPAMILEEGAGIADGDVVLFSNYRTDRAQQLAAQFMQDAPSVSVVCMARFEADWDLPVVFEQEHISNTLGEVLSKNSVQQYRIAETEKFPHVTFFMNALREEPFEKEERVLFDSAKVASFSEKPEMEAREITNKIVTLAEQYDESKDGDVMIIVNYANGDLVGHSGNYDAAVEACKVLDACIEEFVGAVETAGGFGMIIADHGNADTMLTDSGEVWAGHSFALVPCVLFGTNCAGLREGGALTDVAPTILDILGLEKPAAMSGESLCD